MIVILIRMIVAAGVGIVGLIKMALYVKAGNIGGMIITMFIAHVAMVMIAPSKEQMDAFAKFVDRRARDD